MYLRLTSRCNMICQHCAYSCTSKGKDMPFGIFKLAVKAAEDYGETVSLGGGEPTLNPEFWQFIGYALSKDLEAAPWLATNGKRTKDALRLAALARSGTVAVALSQDEWHEKIDPRVVAAFARKAPLHGGCDHEYPNDSREIRTIKEPFKAGRWKTGPRRCVCTEVVIQPDGVVRQCGCLDSPKLGHIRDGVQNEWFTHECWKPEDHKSKTERFDS